MKTDPTTESEEATPTHGESALVQPPIVLPVQFARWWKSGWQKYRDQDRWIETAPESKEAFMARFEKMDRRIEASEARYRAEQRKRFPAFLAGQNTKARDRSEGELPQKSQDPKS